MTTSILKNQTLKTVKFTLFISILTIMLQACGSVPIIGRRQLLLVPDQEVLALSFQQYQDFIRSAPVEKNTANAQMVERVGKRIATAVETFYRNNGYESELKNFSWEFNLVKSKDVNAFCMPGGKIVVYEGLLPITRDEAGLAIVVGHEIAHAVAKHANERISQQMALQYGGQIAGGLLGNNQAAQEIGGLVFGLGGQLGVMLPYARKHEYEADELGIIFMAMAGYDPRVAVDFWTRMSQAGGSSTAEFMSTHPSDQNRIAKIQKNMPKALQYYHGAGVQNKTEQKIKTSVKPETRTSDKWTF
ncbi:MAG: M48 family metallopeptidase [Dysgonamonadaceae bacterium]|nr:M48 family metallopeptidase [Dysgonamonadaceae bacterium]MDD4729582.1 M48 family metallopeptidase [Dysgonamonadaceae bacterium]